MTTPFLQHDHSRRRSEVEGAEVRGDDVVEDGDRNSIGDKHYENDERGERNERDEPRVDAANDCVEDRGSIVNHFATEANESCTDDGVAILIDRGPHFEVGFLKDFHASWGDFFSYLNAYMRATRTKIVISETISVTKRNKIILASAKKRGTHALLLPEEWQTYCRRYICTHGWAHRERGKGLRTRSSLRDRSCEFRFLARMVRVQTGEWQIHVPLETQYRVHTHQIMHEVFEDTPQTVMAPPNSASQQFSSNGRCDGRDKQHDCPRSPGSSNVTSAMNDGSQGVQVLGLKEFHASWEAFLEYVDSYMRATRTKVAIHETIRVAQRNKRLLESEKARRGGSMVLIPNDWKTYSRRYICSLGRRKRPRGEGKRARTHCIRSTGCHFTFTAQVACIDNVWCIQVPAPLQVCTHNHPIVTETFQSYYSPVPVDGVEQPVCNSEIAPESARNRFDNAVAQHISNNFLDIRTIPRDHPMYDAILLEGYMRQAK
uniref:FAR1 domain-containing protein n=1 Tax=Globisporangium ultimum (strain ATCC 200006 / CBS 805.95 / DAOM BR144) TaxID=431595 RepID=K3WFK8_GLOUD